MDAKNVFITYDNNNNLGVYYDKEFALKSGYPVLDAVETYVSGQRRVEIGNKPTEWRRC